MARFRKKPVVIEAVQHHDDQTTTREFSQWLMDAIVAGTVYEARDGGTYIKTLEGRLHVSDGDWIIRGVQGELYPCKPDIFHATYEVE